jgi:hypothetical protein
MSNIGKVALRKKAEPELAAEPHVYVLAFQKKGGGVVCIKGRVPLSAIAVEAVHAPDALDMAIGWGTSRLEEDIQRGKL